MNKKKGLSQHPNRLVHSKSVYLQEHAYDPVDWYPWCEEAWEKAKTFDRPIFLSIGYSSCHWCHVMQKESFQHPEIAQILNAHFIPIKVDREEMPDVDWTYMRFVMGFTGQGGWPLNVFLTPELRPFYGGTYFPPVSNFGQPSFRDVLLHIVRLWNERKDEVRKVSEEILAHLKMTINKADTKRPLDKLIEVFFNELSNEWDPVWKGFGFAPKFPPYLILSSLISFVDGVCGHTSRREQALTFTCETLKMISIRGIHDLVRGGFYRYSVDGQWTIPHFEKMLYTQSFLLDVYARTYLRDPHPLFKWTARRIVHFLFQEMKTPEGLFYSALDADTPDGEGMYYIFTLSDIRKSIQQKSLPFFEKALDIEEQGNFHHRMNILQFVPGLEDILQDANYSWSQFFQQWEQIELKLKKLQIHRPPPRRDTKVLVDWNGFALASIARAGSVFGKDEWIDFAETSFEVLVEQAFDKENQMLYHVLYESAPFKKGMLLDWMSLIHASIELGTVTGHSIWISRAHSFFMRAYELFWDDGEGIFLDKQPEETDILTKIDLFDGAVPSGNGMACYNAIRLFFLTGIEHYRDIVHEIRSVYETLFHTRVSSFPFIMKALFYEQWPPPVVFVSRFRKSRVQREEFIRKVLSYDSRSGIIFLEGNDGSFPAWQKNISGEGTIYSVCQGQVCYESCQSEDELFQLLEECTRHTRIMGSDS